VDNIRPFGMAGGRGLGRAERLTRVYAEPTGGTAHPGAARASIVPCHLNGERFDLAVLSDYGDIRELPLELRRSQDLKAPADSGEPGTSGPGDPGRQKERIGPRGGPLVAVRRCRLAVAGW